MIDIKPGVMVLMSPDNDAIKTAVDETLHEFGLHAYLTAGCDGTHKLFSKHYYNAALDFRIVWTPAQEPAIMERLKGKLPPGFRYLRETAHLHVERAVIPDNLGA